jgi:hypothetical protein
MTQGHAEKTALFDVSSAIKFSQAGSESCASKEFAILHGSDCRIPLGIRLGENGYSVDQTFPLAPVKHFLMYAFQANSLAVITE